MKTTARIAERTRFAADEIFAPKYLRPVLSDTDLTLAEIAWGLRGVVADLDRGAKDLDELAEFANAAARAAGDDDVLAHEAEMNKSRAKLHAALMRENADHLEDWFAPLLSHAPKRKAGEDATVQNLDSPAPRQE